MASDPTPSTTPSTKRIVAGAMSGTSADGVDVALVQIAGSGQGMSAKLLRHHHVPYDAPLRTAIFAMREAGETSLGSLANIGRRISLTYARAINEAMNAAGMTSADIAAIAAHGQTLFHAPPDTLQWLDPALLAAETGCAVVSGFRRADCAAGGQGAPLVPFADYVLFRHPTRSRLLVNLGGIANVSHVPADSAIDKVIALDTGPGNCVSDELMRELHPEGKGLGGGGFD